MTHKSVAKIVSWNLDNEAMCASAAKISTTLGNANDIFEQTKGNLQNSELIKKVLRSGHKSVIEHAVFSVAFWNVSAFVEQFFIECRLASFTVKSRRYVDFSNLGYHTPSELSGDSLAHYHQYMELLFEGYKTLLEDGIPKEDARFLLPYSFCSNFYCTLNARELANVICAIKYGRGRGIPELQDVAGQLVDQIAEIFPALLLEFQGEQAVAEPDAGEWFAYGGGVELIESQDVGGVRLLQGPAQPMEILKLAAAAAHPHLTKEFDVREMIASPRPRELEHLAYTFAISDMTLSGITHLVRHRMQSIVIPPIQAVNHSRVVIPATIMHSPAAKEHYTRILDKANDMLRQMADNDALRKYSYYFALSGNVMNVMTTMNARELMLFIRLRACNRAQWEIRDIAVRMLYLLRGSFPELFDQFGPSCVFEGVCPEGRLSCGQKDEVIRRFRGRG